MTHQDTPTAEDAPQAAPETLLGQLQRGRGRGFLRALRADPAVVWGLVLDCITHDPRWDYQVEDRADYYAQLATAVQFNPAPLAAYLRSVTDDRDEGRTSLTIATLGRLAVLGQTAAQTILREYIAYGPLWDIALMELVELPGSAATEGLAEVVCTRFAPGQPLEESLTYGILDQASRAPLWQAWSEQHPCIARLLDAARAVQAARPRGEPPPYDRLSVDELLTAAHNRNWRQIEPLLLARCQESDAGRLTATFSTANPFAWRVAFAGLVALQRAAPLHEAVLSQVVAYLEADRQPTLPPGRRHVLAQILLRLPPALTHPLIDRWVDSAAWHLRHTGEELLEAQATPADVPRVRSALAAALVSATLHNTDIYRVCWALEILARFPDLGPLPEVEAAFVQVGYSFARRCAAQAMRANAPAWFAATYAYECLWDCEEETRCLGCAAVSFQLDGARERLQVLSADPAENDLVRQAAAARLAAGA